MMSKFPGSDYSCRRRYVNKLLGGKKEKNNNNNNNNNKNKNKEISRSGLVFQVEYLRNGKRYLSSVFSKNQGQESGYQTVQTSSLLLLSFQRY